MCMILHDLTISVEHDIPSIANRKYAMSRKKYKMAKLTKCKKVQNNYITVLMTSNQSQANVKSIPKLKASVN